MKKLINILILVLFFSHYFLSAQIAVGSWRDHLPYIKATNVVQVKNKIFCTTPYSLFYYNTNDYSIETLSITNGLSDIGTNAINYLAEEDLLVVAYSNANVDFIRGTNITNLNDIKQKQVQGSKSINHIEFDNTKAYLACGFGIVVIKLDKLEVEDTYFIGPEASSIETYSIVFKDNNIYAATEQGIYYAQKTANLIDYSVWNQDETIPNSTGKFKNIVSFNNELFANYFNEITATSTVYRKVNNSWELFYTSDKKIHRIRAVNSELFIIEENKILIYDINLNLKRQIADYGLGNTNPTDCITDNNGKLYITDNSLGLVINENESQYESVIANGPYNNHIADIATANDKVWVAGGGRTAYWGNLYNYAEAYSFIDERWSSNILWSSDARDFVKISINPANNNQVFVGSWGAGVFEFQNNQLKNEYNSQNSTLQSQQLGEPFIRISGLTVDGDQNLWVANEGVAEAISVKLNDGSWYSFNYPEIAYSVNLGDIIVTQNNTKWVQLSKGGGLFAFNDNYTPENIDDDDKKRFYPVDENGALITKEIFSIAEDKDGIIWVGTEQGVLTYYNPQNVFEDELLFYAERVKLIDVNDDSLVQYLLSKEKINAIAIDGANRKWFGTENSGVYLMSEDTREELLHFHTGNSPLFSNSITDIGINEKTGEVFFGTNQGIISYMGTATEGDNSFSEAYIYPNPVRENYTGLITITGLAADVNVKITDVSGRLVYETTAFGGQAIWNGKNFGNQKVKTGVYLVFCTDQAGQYKKVLKLLFIN